MDYFDSHCHVESLDLSIVKKCEENGIEIISMSNDIRSYNLTSELINNGYKIYKQFLGYHPENVNQNRVEYIEKMGLEKLALTLIKQIKKTKVYKSKFSQHF